MLKENDFVYMELSRIQEAVSEGNLGGQIWLLLNRKKIVQEFRDFWLDTKIMKEMDYTGMSITAPSGCIPSSSS